MLQNPDGGISYSSRAATKVAVLAGLYNADDYDNKCVPEMLVYCKRNLKDLGEGPNAFGPSATSFTTAS